ncbi:Stringent starvation protein B [hydrothermal vent metagenome]|uniref:Stringent starvation protein B n=1 Tax=hydrothermal vent metagenome TaxID=652676 RepID=A0A3B1AAV7_9ZZZZ
MVSSRPYLIRAMHEWILDSDLTPYVLVDANYKDVVIPLEYVEDGKILLNISSGATQNLNLGNEFVIFSARFSGKSMEVSFPVDAALAVYAKENGRGMMFNTDGTDDEPPSSDPSPTEPSMSGSSALGSAPAKKPSLKIVK